MNATVTRPAPKPAPAPTATVKQPRADATSQRGVWFVADQGVVSLANFAATVLVGRYGGVTELGLYTLALSVQIVVTAMARSLVWTAYTKNLPHHEADAHAAFTGSATVHLAVYASAAAGLIATVAGAAALTGQSAIAWVLLALVPTSVAVLLREHVRRLGMARLDHLSVLALDVVVSTVQISALAALAASGRMTATTALIAIAASTALSAAWLSAGRPRLLLDRSRVGSDWRANWATSKWLAPAAASVTVGNQAYRWILPVLTSVAELGRLGAAQLMAQFTNPIVIGLSNFLSPMTARIYADHGLAALWRYTTKVSVAMVAGIAAFLALVAVIGKPLIDLLLGATAEGVTTVLLVTLTAGALSEALLIPIQTATVNRGRARLLFQAAIVRLSVNVTIGFALVAAYGAVAIGIGMLLGNTVALVWQWIAFARDLRRA